MNAERLFKLVGEKLEMSSGDPWAIVGKVGEMNDRVALLEELAQALPDITAARAVKRALLLRLLPLEIESGRIHGAAGIKARACALYSRSYREILADLKFLEERFGNSRLTFRTSPTGEVVSKIVAALKEPWEHSYQSGSNGQATPRYGKRTDHEFNFRASSHQGRREATLAENGDIPSFRCSRGNGFDFRGQ